MVAENIDIEEIKEIFEIRYDLEGKACELAAQRISETEIHRLAQINADLAGYDEDTREYFLLNRKFHLDFYKASGWNFLCQIITQLFDRVLVFRSIYPIERIEVPNYIEEHKQLLAAASTRDGSAARRIMARHLKNGFTSMMKRRRETT
jgi:DNA-binding GntR family transcriptional regulator